MTARLNLCSSLARFIPAILAMALMLSISGLLRAQTAATLSQVKKIYIEPFTGKRGAQELGANEVRDRLKRDPALTIVDSASQSDAVLKGNGEIWTSGYIGNNPRASSRSPIYNGYLSLTLEGGNSAAAVVLPGHARRADLSGRHYPLTLAGHGARLLLSAVAHEGSGTLSA